ncbi:MAG: orotate phosphoribosyltransferase [bacterium]
MNQEELLAIFTENRALIKGHFQLSSGLHSDTYLQCALVLQHPKLARKLTSNLALGFQKMKIDTVVSPAVGGIVIGQEMARFLGTRAIFTERDKNGHMTLRRGFSIKKGEKCLVIEDVITTGNSTNEVMNVVKASGAEVVGVGTLVDRSPKDIDFKVPKAELLKLDIATHQPGECPMCQNNIPILSPGSKHK